MDPLEAVEALARRARMEKIPQTDVSLRGFPPAFAAEPIRLFPLAWTAAISGIAASILIGFALRGNVQQTASMTPLFNVVQVEMP